MDTKVFVRIGDQVVNADNVVSFDIDGSDIVRTWYIGSETPLLLKPAVPAAALLELLHGKEVVGLSVSLLLPDDQRQLEGYQRAVVTRNHARRVVVVWSVGRRGTAVHVQSR